MSKDSTYNYTPSHGKFFIENGILRGTELPYISDEAGINFGELLLERLRKKPKFIGQVDGATGREETFAEMAEKSVKCAMWLKKENVKPGDVIGICTHNQMDMYVPCFAALYLGAVFNPWWDAGITEELARHFVNLTKPKVVFANEISASVVIKVAAKIGMEIKIVVFGKKSGFSSLEDIIVTNEKEKLMTKEFRCTKLSSIDDPAVIVYTSGTTGLPKGALHSHRSLFGNIQNSGNIGKLENYDGMRLMYFSPLAWSTGILFLLRCIIQYETRIIYPEFTEDKTLELVQKYKVNWLFLGNSLAIRLQQSSSVRNYDLTSLKFVWTGGSVVKKETQNALTLTFPTANFRQCYGITELGGVGLQQNITGDNVKYGSCGTIVDNISMKVIDPGNGQILGPNETGEACFKSAFMMTGYYDNPKATEETIDAEGWLHSGDLVYYDEAGNVFVIDRIKEMIKYRTNHVSPTMVEQVLQKHPEVIEAAVIGIPHDIDDEHPMAFVTTTANAKVTKEELENLVADVLPDYMRLRGGVEFIKEMPHTSSGKIARNPLRKLTKCLH